MVFLARSTIAAALAADFASWRANYRRSDSHGTERFVDDKQNVRDVFTREGRGERRHVSTGGLAAMPHGADMATDPAS